MSRGQTTFAGHEAPLWRPCRRIATLQRTSTLHALRFLACVHGTALLLLLVVWLRGNRLIFCRWSQVADSRDKILDRANRCLRLLVRIEPIINRHILHVHLTASSLAAAASTATFTHRVTTFHGRCFIFRHFRLVFDRCCNSNLCW